MAVDGNAAIGTPAAGFVWGIRSASVAPAPLRTALRGRCSQRGGCRTRNPAAGTEPTAGGDQSVKFQVMIVLLPTVAIPTPMRRAFGFRMFAMWFQCPG